MKPAEIALMDSYPPWTYVIFAIATFSGLLGCILLLLRKSLAKPVFILSLIAILIQMGHSLLLTDSIKVYGAIQAMFMPVMVILIAIYLVYFSNKSAAQGYLK